MYFLGNVTQSLYCTLNNTYWEQTRKTQKQNCKVKKVKWESPVKSMMLLKGTKKKIKLRVPQIGWQAGEYAYWGKEGCIYGLKEGCWTTFEEKVYFSFKITHFASFSPSTNVNGLQIAVQYKLESHKFEKGVYRSNQTGVFSLIKITFHTQQG